MRQPNKRQIYSVVQDLGDNVVHVFCSPVVLKCVLTTGALVDGFGGCNAPRVIAVCAPGKGDNKLGKLLERVRADALAGKDTDVWCSMRFQLPGPLDVAVDLAITKAGQVVAEPSFEGKPVIKMGEVSHGRCLRQSAVWYGVSWVSCVS